jgi:pimeloyl-ACP methyl ester carboxylesterase
MMTTTLTQAELTVDGIRSPLLQAGRDSPEVVVFVHGNPGSSEDWRSLVERVGATAGRSPGMPRDSVEPTSRRARLHRRWLRETLRPPVAIGRSSITRTGSRTSWSDYSAASSCPGVRRPALGSGRPRKVSGVMQPGQAVPNERHVLGSLCPYSA